MIKEAPFVVIQRQSRPVITLPTKSDAVAFIEREKRLWSWIDNSVSLNSGQVNNVANRYRPENWTQQFTNALERDQVNEFEQLMRQRFNDGQCLSSIDPESQSIQALGETDKTIALVALATIHGEAPLQEPNFLRSDVRNRFGVAHGTSILAGIDVSIAAGAVRSLMDARSEIDYEAQRMRALVDRTNDEANRKAEQIAAAAHALGHSHEEAFTKAESERTDAYSKLCNDLDATQKSFEIQMELQAPVAYWKVRSNQYRRASIWALWLLLIFAITAVTILYRLYDAAAAHLPADAAQIPYAALFRASAFALLMTSIAFWAGRILVRIYLSSRHLATDAEERRTMITTFLALTRKSAVKEDDRKFILAALFRPGADGIVNEESAPDTMFAALMGAILKK